MSKVIVFDLKGVEIIVQSDAHEKIEDVYKNFLSKIENDISKINFIYNKKKIDKKLSFEKIANNIDKKRNIINISLEEENKNIINENLINSKAIICPICYESINLNVIDYKISLYDCKNKHMINNILFNEFENIQKIDLSKIICNICNKSINSIDSHNCYKCCSCGINLCSLCKLNHEKNHNIINYENKYYICNIHNESYHKYCSKCRQNLCRLCKNEHNNHDIVYFDEIISKKYNPKKKITELRKYIDKLKNNIQAIIKVLTNVMNNIEIYYKINQDIFNNYKINNKNYHLLKSINDLKDFNDIVIKDIEAISNDNNIINKFNYLINIYNRMNSKVNEGKNLFKKNPNLKYKYDITNTYNSNVFNDIFEVFISYKDKKEYVVSISISYIELDIYTLIDKKKVLSLKGHESHIVNVRYFINNKNNNEYLISTDSKRVVIIWNITNNYNTNYKIKTKCNNSIYSCLLIFPHNNNDNYIITSTISTSDIIEESATKIYSLNTCKFIKAIKNTNNYRILYLLSWYNKNNNNYYIIQLTSKGIIINNLIEDELYSILIQQPEFGHDSGFIYSKDNYDYLCSSSEKGLINIWNLYNKNIFKVINTNFNIINIIQWNDKYIISSDYKKNSIIIIDIEANKIISSIQGQHTGGIICFKKIYHPIYGESLLTASFNKSIKLWTI